MKIKEFLLCILSCYTQINNAIKTEKYSAFTDAEAVRSPTKPEVIYIAYKTWKKASPSIVDPQTGLTKSGEYSYSSSWPDFMNKLAARDDILCKVVLIDKRWESKKDWAPGLSGYESSTLAAYRSRPPANSNVSKAEFNFLIPDPKYDMSLMIYIDSRLEKGAIVILNINEDFDDKFEKIYNKIMLKRKGKLSLLSSNRTMLTQAGTFEDCAALWWNGNQFNIKQNNIAYQWISSFYTIAERLALFKFPEKNLPNIQQWLHGTKTVPEAQAYLNQILYNRDALKTHILKYGLPPKITDEDFLNFSSEKSTCNYVALTQVPGSIIPVLDIDIAVKPELSLKMAPLEQFNFDIKYYYLDIFRAWGLPEALLAPPLIPSLQLLDTDLQQLERLQLQ